MNQLELFHSATAVKQGISAPEHVTILDPNAFTPALAEGVFTVDHIRNGKRINSIHMKNGIVNQGKNKLLSVMFNSGTPISTWYLDLIDNTSYTALSANDVYAQTNGTNGWRAFSGYTDLANASSATTRPAWVTATPASQSITNSTVAVFDITAPGVVKGLFVVGGGSAPQTKGDTAGGGTLWATALFVGGDIPVVIGDALRVTYTVSS